MSGDDSRPSLRAPAHETVFRYFPLASPPGPFYIERMFLLRLCINEPTLSSALSIHIFQHSSKTIGQGKIRTNEDQQEKQENKCRSSRHLVGS